MVMRGEVAAGGPRSSLPCVALNVLVARCPQAGIMARLCGWDKQLEVHQ
jgi:hypothetical protein